MNDIFIKTNFVQADIDMLIVNKIEESLNLEYKEAGALANTDRNRKEISKDVSAFANSDGGLIIYGIKEQNHVPIEISYLNGDQITKEWLEQVIQSTISKRIEGIHVIPIRCDGDISKSIYVVKIPNNSSVPHMALDNRYYRRYNFNSIPMEEYEVRNLYYKREKTKLMLANPTFTLGNALYKGGTLSEITLTMSFSIDNIGNTIEQFYKLEISIPRLVYIIGRQIHHDTLRDMFSRTENEYSIFTFPNKSPLFQNERATINIPNIKITAESLSIALEQPLRLRLYFSGGLEEQFLDLKPHLIFRGKNLSFTDNYR